MAKSLISSAVTSEPLTLEEARQHLRLDTFGVPATHPDDALVEALISTAREMVENYTSLSLAERTYTLGLDSFPERELDLQTWPVSSVTSLVYTRQSGAQQTVTGYTLDNYARPAIISTDTWPSDAKDTSNAVLVTFVAGFNNAMPIPKALKHAMLLIIGHLYENRQDVTYAAHSELPMNSIFLMQPYRIRMGM